MEKEEALDLAAQIEMYPPASLEVWGFQYPQHEGFVITVRTVDEREPIQFEVRSPEDWEHRKSEFEIWEEWQATRDERLSKYRHD